MAYKKKYYSETQHALDNLTSFQRSVFQQEQAEEEHARQRKERAEANVDVDIKHYERQREIHEKLLQEAILKNDKAAQEKYKRVLAYNAKNLERCYATKAEKQKKENALLNAMEDKQK